MGPESDDQKQKVGPSDVSNPLPPESQGFENLSQHSVNFPLGQIVITRGALAVLSQTDIESALTRHRNRDWGCVNQEDWKENDLSLKEGFRILSVYKSAAGTKFWIITESDRGSTCILLPEEY